MAFFLPLSLYFFYLAAVNRAPRARIISGAWDVVGVLTALSGFLLIGGPAILSGLYEQWRMSWLLGNFQRVHELRGGWNEWIMLYAAYFVAVVVLAIWLIIQGTRRTSIYNVDEQEFEQVLRRSLEECSILWKSMGLRKLLLHGAGENPFDTVASKGEKDAASSEGSNHSAGSATIEWSPFPSMCHVSLIWYQVDREIRQNIEARMMEHLRAIRSPDNAAAAWFFTCGLLLLLFSLLMLGAMILLQLLRVAG
jgi:hypothetical protein